MLRGSSQSGRVGEAFDPLDWHFELKHDGFRALASIDSHHCRHVSRRGYLFTLFPELGMELRRNPHYAWCVDLGQLAPASVAAVGPEADRVHRRVRRARPAPG